MANKVLLKKSSVAAKVPLTTDLAYGELALNYADGKLYFLNSSNVIKSFTNDDSVVTSARVTTALGYTPYNSTNPNGYITSSALSSYLALSGGDMTGRLRVGTFAQSQNNTGEAWIGRAADRSAGVFTVQLGGSSATKFEVVDNAWTTVIFNVGMNEFAYKGSNVLHAGNYSSYAQPVLVSGTSIKTINGVSLLGSGDIAVGAGTVTGLTLNSSSNAINPDNVTQNQIGYNTSVSLFGQTDGGLYSSAYNSTWIHQIYGDFRTGQIATRGKNSGTWQPWRIQLDSGNYTSYLADYTSGAYRVISDYSGSNTWYIRSNGRFTWARAHDWTQAYELNLGNGTAASNNGWAELGQNTSNNPAGTWYGTRFVQYTGSAKVDGYVRAGRYYLGDDTNYVLNAGDGSLRVQTANGYIDIGPKNSSWCHIYSDKGIYTNQGIWINGNRVVDASNVSSYALPIGGGTVSGSVTASEFYANGWLRNNSANCGLYSQIHSNHFYATDGGWWNIGGTNGSWCGIRMKPQGHQSQTRGCIYADTSNNVGFLNYSENWCLRVDSGGTSFGNGYQINSDIRIKDNIVDSKYGLKEVMQLRSVEYDRKVDGKHQVGLIAQEVEEIIPEFVETSTAPEMSMAGADGIHDLKSVNYSQMVSVLIKAVQELKNEVDELRSKLGE